MKVILKRELVFLFSVCVFSGCVNRDIISPTADRFPGFTPIDPQGPAAAFQVNLKSIKYIPNGVISFQFVEVLPDGAYVIQQGALDAQNDFVTSDGLKYSTEGQVIGKCASNILKVSDNSQGLYTLLTKVRKKADQAFKITGVSQISDSSEFMHESSIQDLIKTTMGSIAYKSFVENSIAPDNLQMNGSERFFQAFLPHFATQKCFAYVNLASGLCIAGCSDDGEVNIYGIKPESELPEMVSNYLDQMRTDRDKQSDSPLNLHFRLAGEVPIKLPTSTSTSIQPSSDQIDNTRTPTSTADLPPVSDNISDLIQRILLSQQNNDIASLNSAMANLDGIPKPLAGNSVEAGRLNKIGLTSLKVAEYNEAIKMFNSAAQADPADPKYLSNLGFAEMKSGDLNSAQNHLYSSLTIAPSRSVAWGDLGEVFAKKNEQDKAVACFLLGYRVSNGDTLKYLQSLESDDDPAIVKAGRAALSKVQSINLSK